MSKFTSELLSLKLGVTPQQQLKSCQKIKDAMTQLMIHRWETGTAAADDNCFKQASILWFEANTHAYFLEHNNFSDNATAP